MNYQSTKYNILNNQESEHCVLRTRQNISAPRYKGLNEFNDLMNQGHPNLNQRH